MKGVFSLLLFLCPIISFSQKPRIDFLEAKVQITPDPYQKSIDGIVHYSFELFEKTDSLVLDAIGMDFRSVKLDNKKTSFEYDGKSLKIPVQVSNGLHKIVLQYAACPKQTVYFLGWDDAVEGNEQIWTQGQGKYTSHWLPSFDDMNEKLEFDLTIYFDSKYEVIANGILKNSKITGGLKSWHFDMQQPMSSYLAAFVIGNFDKKEILSASGIPIVLYYEPKDSLKVEPTYRHTQEIFDFLEEEIGVPYPWQNYKQVPVQDFLYAGMENTGTTIFSNTYVVDSIAFVDKNYVNVNAHELVHQWFGNLVTEQSGEHHWLHEGFATYYAYLAEQYLFGDDHFYWKIFETAKTLNNLSENGGGEALTDPNANSLTFYEKGAWALVMLRERVGGEAFKKGVVNYLNRYAFKNVTITNFLEVIEREGNVDLTEFRRQWLEEEAFPWEEAKTFLMKKSHSIRMYDTLKQTGKNEWQNDALAIPLRKKLLLNDKDNLSEMDYLGLLKSKDLKMRQATVQVMETVPELLRKDVESLLDDESYLTKEFALYNLWSSFPEERLSYFERTANIIGLPNKNVRLLWLTFALVTPEYPPNKKRSHYDELNGYTSPENHFEVRQLAFQYLNQIGALSDGSLKNLINACTHHVWQFKKSSRNLLRQFLKAEGSKERLKTIEGLLTKKEKELLNMILNP